MPSNSQPKASKFQKLMKRVEKSSWYIAACLLGALLVFVINTTTGVWDIFGRYSELNESPRLAIRQISIQLREQIEVELILSNPTKETASYSGLQLVLKNNGSDDYIALTNYRILAKDRQLIQGPSNPMNIAAGEMHNIFVAFDRESGELPHSYTEALFVWTDASGKRHNSDIINVKKVAHLVRS